MAAIQSSTPRPGATAAAARPSTGLGPKQPACVPAGFSALLGRNERAYATLLAGRPSEPTAEGSRPAVAGGVRGRPPEAQAVDADEEKRPRAHLDPLDPLARTLGALAPQPGPVTMVPPVQADDAPARASRVSLEHVMDKLVRRIAWSGDARSGSARLELGAGALEGAVLVIHSNGGSVSVSLELPPGADPVAWRDRIARRLGTRGLQVSSIDVA